MCQAQALHITDYTKDGYCFHFQPIKPLTWLQSELSHAPNIYFVLLFNVASVTSQISEHPDPPANHSRHQVYVLGTIFAIWCDSIRLGTKQFTEDCRNSYIMQWASPPLFAGVPATHPVLLQAGKPRCFEAAYNLEHRIHFVKSL